MVGSNDDPHVSAVLASTSARPVLVIDVATFAARSYALEDGYLRVDDAPGKETVEIGGDWNVRGWIRRIAPPEWQRGLAVESHEAAVNTAWLALLTAAVRTCGVTWLTGLDALVAAENKLVQQAAARKVGAWTPPTIVTSDANAAQDALGDDIVLKPLGPGHFFEDGKPRVVYAAAVSSSDRELGALASAPFLAQRRIHARRHLRVVTVQDSVWAAELDASSHTMDWRADPDAHRRFTSITVAEDVSVAALAVAAQLGLGYSSQDWVLADDGPYLLDVNPAGQWLFLPPETARPVTMALGDWLSKTSS